MATIMIVAQGDVALGFQQRSELIHLPGLDVLGAMPQAVEIEAELVDQPALRHVHVREQPLALQRQHLRAQARVKLQRRRNIGTVGLAVGHDQRPRRLASSSVAIASDALAHASSLRPRSTS